MTVQELIVFLQSQPQDVPVIFQHFSDYADLEAADIHLVPATSKEIVVRQGRHIGYRSWQWPKNEVAVFEDVLVFPGN